MAKTLLKSLIGSAEAARRRLSCRRSLRQPPPRARDLKIGEGALLVRSRRKSTRVDAAASTNPARFCSVVALSAAAGDTRELVGSSRQGIGKARALPMAVLRDENICELTNR
jgi:hypothetical protein